MIAFYQTLFARSIVFALFLGLIGCAHTESIPTYPDLPAPQALHLLAERSRAISTVSAQALVTLTRPDGQTVRLDAALVMRPPNQARLRAYKFGNVVFDITITPDGVWLLASDMQHEQTYSATAKFGQLMRQWIRLASGSFDESDATAENTWADLLVHQSESDGITLLSQIDRKTLTLRKVTMRDRSGRQRFVLRFSDYAQFGAAVWPLKVEATSDDGRILVALRDVEINGALPPAFQPPARAEKLP